MSEDEAEELKRKLEQARRLASATTDFTTMQRLREFAEEISEKLRSYFARRRAREMVRARAWELWEQNGRPPGRDLEFWLQAEREIRSAGKDES
jgi:hypothetical protein